MEEFLGRQIYFTGTTCECLPRYNGTRSGDFDHEKKKNGKNLFPRNLSPGVLLMFSSLGGYRWRSPSDRLVRYNEILVLLPLSSIQKCQERRNWCTTSKGALYSGCWTLFDWGGRFDWPQWFTINSPFVFYQHFGLFSSISSDQVPLNSLLVWRYHRRVFPVHVTLVARASPTWQHRNTCWDSIDLLINPKSCLYIPCFQFEFSGVFWHGPGRLFHSIRRK